MVEAWALLRQHSNKLNMEELLHFLYETSQELDLMKELLKLPLGLTEQVEGAISPHHAQHNSFTFRLKPIYVHLAS